MTSAFLIASVVLAVIPGPGVLFIVTRSLIQGRRFGLASVAGVALGNLGNAIGASVGLAAVFAVSALAFTIVKYLGALYLVYLGLQAIRSSRPAKELMVPGPASPRRILRDGFLVALLNPKTAVFFAAFLPQFMTADSPAIALAPALARTRGVRAVGRYLTGGSFIGLGIYTVARD